MKKFFAFVPALWLTALSLLTQLTVSGSNVALESSEISSITDWVVNWMTSMLNLTTWLFNPAIIIAVVWIIIGVIGGFSRLKNRLWSKRKR